MPGSTAAILNRRRAFRGPGEHWRPSLESFCIAQVERIERMQQERVRRVWARRRSAAAVAVDKAGCEVQLTIRGRCGNSAHPDDEAIPDV